MPFTGVKALMSPDQAEAARLAKTIRAFELAAAPSSEQGSSGEVSNHTKAIVCCVW